MRLYEWTRDNGDLKPGDVVVMEDGKRLLVGDINVLGGQCDDCSIMMDEITTVERSPR